MRARHAGGRLQQQRGLADAGLAAEQHERAGNDAAAEHAIEFVDAGGQARVLFDLDIGVQLRRAAGARERVTMPCRRSAAAFERPFLDERVPRAAVARSAPATSATGCRTPDRRTPSWALRHV